LAFVTAWTILYYYGIRVSSYHNFWACRMATPRSSSLCLHYQILDGAWGVTCKKNTDYQVSKTSESQISDYALMNCVPLIVRVHYYL